MIISSSYLPVSSAIDELTCLPFSSASCLSLCATSRNSQVAFETTKRLELEQIHLFSLFFASKVASNLTKFRLRLAVVVVVVVSCACPWGRLMSTTPTGRQIIVCRPVWAHAWPPSLPPPLRLPSASISDVTTTTTTRRSDANCKTAAHPATGRAANL